MVYSFCATLAHNKNRLSSLDGNASIISEMSDGAAIISEVGKPLYNFYGYETAGVFSTTEEAAAANLKTPGGVAFGAGDVHFVDQKAVNDGVIDVERPCKPLVAPIRKYFR